MTDRIKVPGRGWAYAGVTLGGLVSIAANVTHTYVPPAGTAADWHPARMAIVFAFCWPVFLFVAIEILARTPWPRAWNWMLLRWLGLTPVALVAAFVSYRHLSGLLLHYGEEPLAAYTGPLAVDGLMVMATGALIATSRHRSTVPAPGPIPASVPVAVPQAPQGAPATPNSKPSIVDTPPVPRPAPKPAVPAVPVPAPVAPTPADVATRITKPHTSTPATPAAATGAGTRPTRTRAGKPTPTAAKQAPATTDTPVTESHAAQLTLPVAPDLLTRAAQVAKEYRTSHGTPITAGQLAVRLKVTSEQAAQALAVLDLHPDNPTTPIQTVNGRPTKEPR